MNSPILHEKVQRHTIFSFGQPNQQSLTFIQQQGQCLTKLEFVQMLIKKYQIKPNQKASNFQHIPRNLCPKSPYKQKNQMGKKLLLTNRSTNCPYQKSPMRELIAINDDRNRNSNRSQSSLKQLQQSHQQILKKYFSPVEQLQKQYKNKQIEQSHSLFDYLVSSRDFENNSNYGGQIPLVQSLLIEEQQNQKKYTTKLCENYKLPNQSIHSMGLKQLQNQEKQNQKQYLKLWHVLAICLLSLTLLMLIL